MSKHVKWNSGPPPSSGWWPASVARDAKMLRWWNGKLWSLAATTENDAEEAARISGYVESAQSHVEWTDRPKSWPARSFT